MNRYLIASITLFILVGIATLFTRHYGWYNTYWYTDVILHLISGFAFGLMWYSFSEEKKKISIILGVAAFATFGSVLWEFWEYFGWHITPTHARYYIPELGDTLSDIFCGMVGGFLSSLLGNNKK